MSARRERAIAHTTLRRLAILLAAEGFRGLSSAEFVDLWRVLHKFTKPRPWWRFW